MVQKQVQEQPPASKGLPANQEKQGVDKSPGEEHEKGDMVTDYDLKGKKVDRDITDPNDDPISKKSQ